MIAVHVHGQLDHFLVQCWDYRHQSEVVQRWRSTLVGIIFDSISGKFINQSLDSSGSVNVQRDFYKLCDHTAHDQTQGFCVSHLDDFLTEVITELVAHHVPKDWEHVVNETLEEGCCVELACVSLRGCRDLGLQHPAPSLVEAVKV